MSETSVSPRVAGVVGFFETPTQILEATAKVRDANYQSFDCFTPFPVHGLEHAQGLKRSPLPYVTLAAGFTGFMCAFGLQYWTSAVDWPINVGGKPMNSWPAFVPVMFELTVLFAALCTVGAMFLLNGLPNTRRKAVDPLLTRDRFAIVIDAPPELPQDADEEDVLKAQKKRDKFRAFDVKEAMALLQSVGAKEVRTFHAEGWF
jgi:hypothetical protein